MCKDRDGERQADEEFAERFRWLVDELYGGNQQRLADDLGMSQASVSLVASGKRRPGLKLIRALATLPNINADWIRDGVGDPLKQTRSGNLPVARCVLPSLPEDHLDLLTGERHPVAESMERPSRYYLRLGPSSALVREPNLALLPGDLLLLDADPGAWNANLGGCIGALFGVRLGTLPAPTFELGVLGREEGVYYLNLLAGVAFLRLPDPERGGSDMPNEQTVRYITLRLRRGKRRPNILGFCDVPDLVAMRVYTVRPFGLEVPISGCSGEEETFSSRDPAE